MVQLGFQFDPLTMTVTLPTGNLREIMELVGTWLHKTTAHIHDLKSLVGKLLFVAQCCRPARLFTNKMLETLRVSPLQGNIHLSSDFRKDLALFQLNLPTLMVCS